MNQDNQNNNQQTNNDLDSLLKEFQTLSETPTEPVKPVEPIIQESQVNAVNSTVTSTTESVPAPEPVTAMNNAGINNPTSAPQPVMPTPTQDIPVVPNAPIPPVKPAETVVPEPLVNPGLNVNLNTSDGDIVPPTNGNGNTPDENVTPPVTPAPTGKNSNLFIIIIFLIIGVFILFIPKISDFFSNKPGKETKPTATPVATATATPTPVAKEKKMNCKMPEVVVSETNKIQTIYRYYHKDNKVTKLEKIFKNMFTTVDDTNTPAYSETKNTCDTLATKYAGITGYTVTCEEKDNTFTVTYAYDLEHFVNPTEIIVGTATEKIESPALYGDKIATVKEKMEAEGATCK